MEPNSTGPVVLLVEDDADQAVWTQDTLHDAGFRVVVAAEGAQGLALLDVVHPAVVIADMVMPVLDGLGLLKRIAERPPPHPPVLAVSALASYLPEALHLGAAAALPKPVDPALLVWIVRELVAGRPPPTPPPAPGLDERGRLAAIRRLRLDRPAPSPALSAFVQRVARLFDVPICMTSVVTETRHRWSAACGLPADLAAEGSVPRSQSFCVYSVASRTPLVVQDALENPIFRDNLLVRTRGLRFYAGYPLIERRGEALGTLCLLDFRERPAFGTFDVELLGALSTRVLAELEWRERAERPDEPACSFRHLDRLDDELGILGRAAFDDVLRAAVGRFAHSKRPLAVAVGAFPPERRHEVVELAEARFETAFLGRLGLDRIGALAPGVPVGELEEELREIGGHETEVVATVPDRGPEEAGTVLWGLEAALGSRGLAPRTVAHAEVPLRA